MVKHFRDTLATGVEVRVEYKPDRHPFQWGRRIPMPVLMTEIGMSLVRVAPCYHDLSELHYDHARHVNFRYAKNTGIDDTYATALMGGEPYSDWN